MSKFGKLFCLSVGLCLIFLLTGCGGQRADKENTLLNVSFDTTRELYQAYNKAFVDYYEQTTGKKVKIMQSHGGSGSQARSVVEGVDGDVVSLALAPDVDLLNKVNLLPKDWQREFPHNSAPFTSTIVFVVKKGNPYKIKDWDDLIKNQVQIITPNPKSSGGACWNFLGAYVYAREKFSDDKERKAFLRELYSHVKIMDPTARVSTNTFVNNNQGDVLIAWESEALLLKEEHPEKYEIIYPSISVLAEPTVAEVSKITAKHHNHELAKAYLDYLYSPTGQGLVAKYNFRPVDPQVLKKWQDKFPTNLHLVTVEELGGWPKVYKEFFADGQLFDQIIN